MGPQRCRFRSRHIFPFHCWPVIPSCRNVRLMSEEAHPWALGRGVRHSPFHCWACFVRHQIINFMSERGPPWGYTLGYCQPSLHPFHWPTPFPVSLADTLFARKHENIKSGKKTLEWSTILSRNVKMDGFENPGLFPGWLFPG